MNRAEKPSAKKLAQTVIAAATAAAMSATMVGVSATAAQAAPSQPASPTYAKVASNAAGSATIKIKAVKGASSYQYQVSKTKSFKKVSAKKTSSGTSITVSKLAEGGKYFVRARACSKVKGAGERSAWSVYGKAVTIKKYDPKNGGTADIDLACTGQDTKGLATLEEATSQNRMEFTDADKSSAVSISQDTVTYLHTKDYGKSVDLKCEILTPSTAQAGKTPLVVWINGGGFTSSDPSNNLDTRIQMAKAGYVVASVQHRTSAVSNFPAPLQDIKAAIRFLKANASEYKFDASKVAVGGNSSGGYYASMIGVTGNTDSIDFGGKTFKLDVGANLDQSSAVNAVIDYYGVSDLSIIGSGLPAAIADSHKSAATTEAILLNGAAAAKKGVGVFDKSMEAKVAAASPLTYIDKNDPEFIFFHGTADTLVSPVATKMLQKRLDDAGVHTERYVIEGAGHGGAAFQQSYVNDKVAKFLDTYAQDSITTTTGANDPEAGTRAYEAADLPTLAEATAGADKVSISSGKWNVEQVKGVTYKVARGNRGTYTNLEMNLLIPSKAGDSSKRPVLYCAQCGGFNKSNPNAMSYLRYAERGYIVAIAEIRVAPSVTMPAPIQDAKAGVRWLRAHAADYNINSDCIIATGSSAGGYTGVMLGVLGNTTQYSDDVKFDVGDNLKYSSAVQGVVDLYGVSDLTIIGAHLDNYGVHDSESNTEALWVNGTAFGSNPGASVFKDMKKTAKFSPFTYVDKHDAPFLMLHGTSDTIVSPVATKELYDRLTAAGVKAERYSVVGAGHGGWQFSTDKVNNIVDNFMDEIAAAHK